MEGIVVRVLSGAFTVETEKDMFECSARGIFRLHGITPLAGDRVSITVTDIINKSANIELIHERRNETVRPRAANIDQLCIIISPRMPEPDFLLVDKLLIYAGKLGIGSILCANKSDLSESEEFVCEMNEYRFAGVSVLQVSAENGENTEILAEMLAGKVTALAGQSGVGKSSVINRLAGTGNIATGLLSVKNERGKHTTRHTELIPLPEKGYIIDTPGFSSFDAGYPELSELPLLYNEFETLSKDCRFHGCMHINEPDCAVKNAFKKGGTGHRRYLRYLRLYDIIKENQKYRQR